MGKGLTDGMKILKTIALGLGGLAIISVIVLLIVGVLAQTVAEGNIPVPNATNTSVASVNTDVNTYVDSILDNLPLIIGLVALVVVLAVIGIWVYGRNSKSGFGGDDSF